MVGSVALGSPVAADTCAANPAPSAELTLAASRPSQKLAELLAAAQTAYHLLRANRLRPQVQGREEPLGSWHWLVPAHLPESIPLLRNWLGDLALLRPRLMPLPWKRSFQLPVRAEPLEFAALNSNSWACAELLRRVRRRRLRFPRPLCRVG